MELSVFTSHCMKHEGWGGTRRVQRMSSAGRVCVAAVKQKKLVVPLDSCFSRDGRRLSPCLAVNEL
eukprot:scaffold274235_cov37-Tisochrysis_lutea.AAC.1